MFPVLMSVAFFYVFYTVIGIAYFALLITAAIAFCIILWLFELLFKLLFSSFSKISSK